MRSIRQRYEPLRPLGIGGMGEIWLVRDRDLPDTPLVAMKRLHLTHKDDQERIRQFEREAKIGSSLRHPNIVAVRDFGRDQAGPYLILDYVTGPSVAVLLRKTLERQELLPLPVLLGIAADVSRALSYAHSGGDATPGSRAVLHRDLSPDNILLEKTGEAKLADFGIAKAEGSTTMTDTGSVKGKVGYMAPELFEGATADVRSDIYSLGTTLFMLACGVRPFHGRTEGEQIRAILTSAPTQLTSLRRDVPQPLAQWIQGALQRDPAQRPNDCRQLVEIANRLLPESGEGHAATAALIERVLPNGLDISKVIEPGRLRTVAFRGPTSPRERRRRTQLRIALGLGVLALGLTGGLWGLGRRAFPSAQGPKDQVSSPAAPGPSPIAAALIATPVRSQPQADTAPATPPQSASPPTSASTLLVKAAPWAQVFLDGHLLGVTPLSPIHVTPGPHSVILVNGPLHVRRKLTVSVRANQAKVVRYVLKDDGANP